MALTSDMGAAGIPGGADETPSAPPGRPPRRVPMLALISPAKAMAADVDTLAPISLPQFLPQAETLLAALRAMDPVSLRRLWQCSEAVAQVSLRQLEAADLRRRLTPAVLAYRGIQYQYMAPGVMEAGQLACLQERLRILSGLYGVLRPFDGVTPYRLEMQARLAVGGCRNLYEFWGGRLADALAAETDCLLDLASEEYSRAVRPHLPPSVRWVRCVFGERRDGRIVEKGTLCKMARGRMVRFLADRGAEAPEDLRGFCELGYRYEASLSSETRLVFCKGGT